MSKRVDVIFKSAGLYDIVKGGKIVENSTYINNHMELSFDAVSVNEAFSKNCCGNVYGAA